MPIWLVSCVAVQLLGFRLFGSITIYVVVCLCDHVAVVLCGWVSVWLCGSLWRLPAVTCSLRPQSVLQGWLWVQGLQTIRPPLPPPSPVTQ